MNKELYDLVKNQFPIDDTYCSQTWIFPQHIDIMLKLLDDVKDEFDRDVCETAIILHDVGLVYKRESKDAIDHESRSVEFALNALKDRDSKFVDHVVACIKATEPGHTPITIEEKIVRSVDTFSQIDSFHFFAKAYFAHDLEWFINWFDKKIENSKKKICLPYFVERAKPIQDLYARFVKEYRERLI